MNKKPLVINLFAGPGAGKSTGAAYIFAMLKMHGIEAELVTEFAKDAAWEQNLTAIQNQLYVFGTQSYRLSRCADKVAVIVTDSPLLLSSIYCKQDEPYYKSLQETIFAEWSKYDNKNYYIRRMKPYSKNGRFQEEKEALQIDARLKDKLSILNISYIEIAGEQTGYDQIVSEILTYINNNQGN